MSYGPDFSDAARSPDSPSLMRSEKAQSQATAFERPTKFDLRINLLVAKTLGIELSPAILARADEVTSNPATQTP